MTRLIVESGPDAGRGVDLGPSGVLLGRDPRSDLVLEDRRVSRRHAHVSLGADGVVVHDLQSANGTYLDGVRISAPTMLPEGGQIRIGDTTLVLSTLERDSLPDPRVGSLIGPYRLIELIAHGGMGSVYRVRREDTAEVLALKLLSPRLAGETQFRERFDAEWRAAASIQHPNILRVEGAGDAGGELYIAMQYVEGGDLSRVVRAGPLPPDRALLILTQIADALDAAHAVGLVHRDVKPENILVASGVGAEEADHAYLCDFGISKNAAAAATINLTQPGQMLGTAHYMAPEQVTGEGAGPATDVYALGCVLYECLTGEAPYPRDNEKAVLYAQVHEKPPVPSDAQPELPVAIDHVLEKALAKQPGERFESCMALVAAARNALAKTAGDSLSASAPGSGASPGTPGILSERDTLVRPARPTFKPRSNEGSQSRLARFRRSLGSLGGRLLPVRRPSTATASADETERRKAETPRRSRRTQVLAGVLAGVILFGAMYAATREDRPTRTGAVGAQDDDVPRPAGPHIRRFTARATSPVRVMLTWEVLGEVSGYRILRNGVPQKELPRYRETFEDRTAPGQTYRYSLLTLAEDGSVSSSFTTTVPTPPRPPLTHARLAGEWKVFAETTRVAGAFPERYVGNTHRATWTFNPRCSGRGCPVGFTLGYDGGRPAVLRRRGVTFRGRKEVRWQTCAGSNRQGPTTVLLNLTVTRDGFIDGVLRATRFRGTQRNFAPPFRGCARGSVTFYVRGQLKI